MEKNRKQEVNKQGGSLTVEAVVAFTGFLFTIVTILAVINVCRAQMLISSAVDTAAKQMSQYAYFYKMSGLQKFSNGVSEKASVGKDNINDVIGTVDELYQSLGKTSSDASAAAGSLGQLSHGVSEQGIKDMQSSIKNVSNDVNALKGNIASVGNSLQDIGNNPILYMKSLVAIAGEEGMGMAKRAAAAALGKIFTQNFFGDTKEEANEALTSLGVEDGLDGLNFNLSTMFTDDGNENIKLVVFYKVKLFNFLEGDFLETTVSKVAECRAWLGGDNLQAFVEPSADEGGTPEGGGSSETTPGETTPETTVPDTTDPSETTETTAATEPTTAPTEPEKESYWSDPQKADDKFAEDMKKNHLITPFEQDLGSSYLGYNNNTLMGVMAFTNVNEYTEPAIIMAYLQATNLFKNVPPEDAKGDPTYLLYVYVPENIDPVTEAVMKSKAIELSQKYEEICDKNGIPKEDRIKLNVALVKEGGDYDYKPVEPPVIVMPVPNGG